MVLTQKYTSINSVLGGSRPKEDRAEQCTAEEHVLSVERALRGERNAVLWFL